MRLRSSGAEVGSETTFAKSPACASRTKKVVSDPTSCGFELRGFERQPFDAGIAEVDLNARVTAASLGVDDDAHAELRVTNALPDPPRRPAVLRVGGARGHRLSRGRLDRCGALSPLGGIDIDRSATL